MKKIVILLFVLLCVLSNSIYASNETDKLNEMLNEIITNYNERQEQIENTKPLTNQDGLKAGKKYLEKCAVRVLLIILTGMIIPVGTLIRFKKKLHPVFVNKILVFNATFLLVICSIIVFFVIVPQPQITWRKNRHEIQKCYFAFTVSMVISTFVGKLILTEVDQNDDLLDSFIAVTRSKDKE